MFFDAIFEKRHPVDFYHYPIFFVFFRVVRGQMNSINQ